MKSKRGKTTYIGIKFKAEVVKVQSRTKALDIIESIQSDVTLTLEKASHHFRLFANGLDLGRISKRDFLILQEKQNESYSSSIRQSQSSLCPTSRSTSQTNVQPNNQSSKSTSIVLHNTHNWGTSNSLDGEQFCQTYRHSESSSNIGLVCGQTSEDFELDNTGEAFGVMATGLQHLTQCFRYLYDCQQQLGRDQQQLGRDQQQLGRDQQRTKRTFTKRISLAEGRIATTRDFISRAITNN